MCFSPTASFTASAVIGAAGCLTVSNISNWKQAPLAAIPLIFAVQQASEGMVWLGLLHPAATPSRQIFTDVFLFLALALWPVLVPLAVGLVETNIRHRRLQWLLVAAGLAVGLYAGLDAIHHPYRASIAGSSICYINGEWMPLEAIFTYVLVTCLPPLLSSHASLRLFGVVVLVGMAVSLAAYKENFVSVWCFFAAAASLLIYRFFRMERARHAEPAPQT